MTWALSSLVVEHPEAMAMVRRCGGLKVVVDMLYRFNMEGRACEYICTFITQLVGGELAAAACNRQVLRELGVKDAITDMLVKLNQAQSDNFETVSMKAEQALMYLKS